MSDTNASPPGWHPDAQNPGQERYWDGTAWTEQRRPLQGPPPGQTIVYQQAPQKKSHTLRNVLLIFALLSVLVIGGCIALIGTAANEVSKEIDKSLAEEAENDKPKEVKEGQAFEHDGFAVAKGWKVVADDIGWAEIIGATVTLKDDQDSSSGGRSALLTFRLYDGATVVNEINCTSNEMQEGETSKLDCGSTDDLGKYDTIKVSDLF